VDDCPGFIVRKEPLPLSPKRTALKERLTARLELSQKYERKIKRTKSKIGLTAAYKALDKLTAQQLDLEQQIMSTRCAARSDFAVKLAIYDLHCSWHHVAHPQQVSTNSSLINGTRAKGAKCHNREVSQGYDLCRLRGYLTRSAQETRLSPVQPAEIGAKHHDGATPKIVRF
jgi:hypothetical protein